MIRVAIAGCGGRMGRALISAVTTTDDMKLTGASESHSSTLVGRDVGMIAGLGPLRVTITENNDEFLKDADGVIDFSAPVATMSLVEACGRRQLPLVIGTTGFSSTERATLANCTKGAKGIPIVFAPNMSVGVNVLFRLIADAVKLLGSNYDIEVIEAHHSQKGDSPSGTALRIAHVLAEATSELGSFKERATYGRHGNLGPRSKSQIGIHAIRGGDIIGDHTVMFCGGGERLEITHRASSRQTFVSGALRALRWVMGKPPGLYDMQDVLSLR